MSLTAKQRELMLYIQRYQDASCGVSPSYDEMTAALGLQSKSGIHRLLEALEERGFIEKMRSRARAITILRRIHDPAAAPISDEARDAFKALVREIAHDPEPDLWKQRRKAQKLLERYGP